MNLVNGCQSDFYYQPGGAKDDAIGGNEQGDGVVFVQIKFLKNSGGLWLNLGNEWDKVCYQKDMSIR